MNEAEATQVPHLEHSRTEPQGAQPTALPEVEPGGIHIQANLNANMIQSPGEPDSPEEWLEWASWWA